MKICIVTSSFPRYPGDYSGFFAYEQAKALSQNHEVHVIYPDNLKNKQKFNDTLIRHPISYPLKSYPLAQVHLWELPGVLLLLVDLANKIRYVRRKFHIDLFYAFWTIPCGFICSLCRGKTPMVLGLMGSDLEVFGKRMISKPFISHAIKKADKMIAVSEDLKEESVGLGGDRERIVVIPTGVDISLFKPMDKPTIKQKLGLPEGFIWIFSGSLFKLKRVDWILNLSASLSKQFDFHVVIIGDGPERKRLEDMAKSLGIKNILFIGKVPREAVPFYMAASDVLLLLSETEGLPNCIQEAMATGIPVVATKVGGMPDIIQDGTSGFLVDNEPQAELALKKLMSTPGLAVKMGAAALSYARDFLAVGIIMDKIEKNCQSMRKIDTDKDRK